MAEQTHQAFRADKVTGNTNVSLVPQGNVNNKWLELCISSSPSPYVLGEVDVAGRQTDQTVFNKIRAKYYANKASSRLFGFLTLRIPKGGVFVQVSIASLASATCLIIKIWNTHHQMNEGQAASHDYLSPTDNWSSFEKTNLRHQAAN